MVKVGRRRSLWTGVALVLVFFACVTLAIAWIGGGPDVPHPVDGERAACTTCHAADRLPEDHHDRTGDGCRACHSETRTHPDAGGG